MALTLNNPRKLICYEIKKSNIISLIGVINFTIQKERSKLISVCAKLGFLYFPLYNYDYKNKFSKKVFTQ